MNFRKTLSKVVVTYDDNTTEEFSGPMRFHCSRNGRKGDSGEEWYEYYISWFNMIEIKKARPVEDVHLPEPLIAEELAADPAKGGRFAGIADGRAFYFPDLNEQWKEFNEFTKSKPNGSM